MLAKKLLLTLKRNGIIVLETAAMLHDTDAIIAIMDSAHKAMKKPKVPRYFIKKSHRFMTSTGEKVVLKVNSV